MNQVKIVIGLTLSVFAISTISYTQDHTSPKEVIYSNGPICSRTNTDTIEFSNHQGYKSAHSRIAKNQIDLNFTKLFYQKFPQENLQVPVTIVFELTISEQGILESTEILRSLLPDNTDDQLIKIVEEVTADSWIPAEYKGKKLVSQITLPITISPKNNKEDKK